MKRFISSLAQALSMKRLRLQTASCILGGLLVSLFMASAGAQLSLNGTKKNILASNTLKTDQVTAVLSLYAPMGLETKSKEPKQWLVLEMRHAPGWHTYWKNPGDAGLATQLSWTTPAGMKVGATLWPQPERIVLGELINFGFTDTTALLAPLVLEQPVETGRARAVVKLHASWLVCRQECIPQEGDLELDLLAKTPASSSSSAMGVQKVLQDQALELELARGQATASNTQRPGELSIQLKGLPPSLQGHRFDVFPEQADLLKTRPLAAIQAQQSWSKGTWTFESAVSELRAESPQAWPLLLLDLDALPNAPKSYRVLVHMDTPWPSARSDAASTDQPSTSTAATTASAPKPPDVLSASRINSASRLSLGPLLIALASAFLGGLILNLMPCVLPVLAIKALSFIPKAHEHGHTRRFLAEFYALGIWVTLIALGGLILLLRSGGAQLGWGFQLQSPSFVVFLSVLFTLIALNLWGVFEMRQTIPGFLGALGSKNPLMESFLSGALSVLIASPCTAPFMGASIGLAFSIPTWQGLLLFSMLALGLSFPILLIGWFPKAIQWIPKPGPWMMTFRASLGFPMALTVLWLTWVLAQQVGITAMVAQMMLLLLVSACAWCFNLQHKTPAPKTTWSTKMAWLLLLAFVALQSTWVWWVSSASISLSATSGATSDAPPLVSPRAALNEPPLDGEGLTPLAKADTPLKWGKWSKEAVRRELELGNPVFVDYTAAWCLSCQFNKLTFQKESVQNAFKAHHVSLFEADWTRQDPAITQSLNEMGRNGVPVYILLSKKAPPRFLSEFVSEDEILNALGAL